MRLFLILFLCLSVGFAQPKIATFSVADGLSQGMVSCMVQDKEGFMWFGTRGGLNRFDGYTFKQYLHSNRDTTSLADNVIAAMTVDKRGRIWMLTENRLLDCFDPKTGIFHHLGEAYNPQRVSVLQVYDIHAAQDGRIWVGCGRSITEMTVPDDFPQKPERVRAIRYHQFTCGNELPCRSLDPDTWRLHVQPDGRVALLSAAGEVWLTRASGDGWDVHPLSSHHAGKNRFSNDNRVQVAPDGRVFQLYDHQLICWQQGNITFSVPYPHQAPSGIKAAMQLAPNGDLFFTSEGCLYKVSNKSLRGGNIIFERLYDADILSLLLDSHSRLWAGTIGYGIRSLSVTQSPFAHLLPTLSIRVISAHGADAVSLTNFALEYPRLIVLDAHAPYPQHALTPPLNTAISQVLMRDGTRYTRFCNQRNNTYYAHIQPPNGEAFTLSLSAFLAFVPMEEDANGRVWFGDEEGILFCHQRHTDRQFTQYSYRHLWKQLQEKVVTRSILPDRSGNRLWIATSQGLVQADINAAGVPTFRLWADAVGSPTDFLNNHLLSLLEDPQQPDRYLWVGTSGGGLCRMDKQTGACIRFTKTEGLPDNVVYGILSDDFGNLWVSTNFGLSRFSLRTRHFFNFTAADGLQDNEFNTFSYYKHTNGVMFFGGVKGLTAFHPKDVQPDTAFSPIVLTELRINNKPIGLRDSSQLLQLPLEYTREIRLKHNQNFLSVSFSALDFKQFGRATYWYKLEGMDADWVFGGARPDVSYPNLPPGTYTLHVANTNEAGVRNPHHVVLRIVISPPWWRSTLAYMLYALAVAGAVWAVFRFQVNRIRLQNEFILKEKEAQQFQELDELKTRFFTNITHEFRTPLTLILEPARQLLQVSEDTLRNPKLQLVVNNSQRLLVLVNQLLDVAKLEEGKMQLYPAEGDVLPIMREIFDYFAPLAQRKRQTLRWDCDLDTLTAVADRAMLDKVSYNLLSNALKFTPEGGEIRLRVQRTTENQWQLIVSDTGIGMEERAVERIFDRFYQADGSHTRKGEGTGIGLALVKELVELTNGSIAVQSVLGKGSIFTVTLPIGSIGAGERQAVSAEKSTLLAPVASAEWQENDAPHSTETLHETSPEATTVLLVEDNDEMRQYVRMTLESAGYAVLEAANGAAGIDMAREHIPDLVISDVMMPEKDGFELTAALKGDMRTSHIPVVLLTAKGRLESKIEGYRLGADAYLSKPFYTEELLVRLQQLLAVRQVLQQKFAQPQAAATASEESTLSDETPQPSAFDTAFLARIDAYIEANLADEQLSVESLADEFAMSRSQFYRKITALTGNSPARFVRNLRLDAAYRLLITQPELRVSEVLLLVGMNSEHHFRSLFKERFGVSPNAVRSSQE